MKYDQQKCFLQAAAESDEHTLLYKQENWAQLCPGRTARVQS